MIFRPSEQKTGGCSMNGSSFSGGAWARIRWLTTLVLTVAISPLSGAAAEVKAELPELREVVGRIEGARKQIAALRARCDAVLSLEEMH